MKYAALLLFVSLAFGQSPKRLFIEERIVERKNFATGFSDGVNASQGLPPESHPRDVSAELSRDILKTCPSAVVITDDLSTADYRLHIYPGASTLYNPSSKDVVHVFSTTKFKALSKDVCQYVNSLLPTPAHQSSPQTDTKREK